MQERLFWRIFTLRSIICFFIIISLFLSCILRVAVISNSGYSQVQQTQSSIRLKISDLRGTIYDKNMFPITNSESKIIACISPTPRAITAISTVLNGEKLQSVLERLKSGKPVTCEVPREISCNGIICTKIFLHNTTKNFAIHTIGYTDSDGKGVSGIEKAYDEFLYSEKDAAVYFSCDGKGNILQGIEPKVENDTCVIANGVVSTIDINIQSIVEETADFLESGAIIVADAKTSKIRGIASRPDFDVSNITDYLETANSPLLNRTINAYNVGSAFKPCIAIAGVENKISNFTHNCTGSTEIIDRVFKCHKRDGHGIMNLSYALANSCNTYFYNFAFKIGGEYIYNIASNLNFGKQIKICENLYTAKGSIPTKEKLQNIAHLANFSIGQGDLLSSPISMLTLYSSIANGGSYYMPSIVEGTLKNGKFTEYNIGNATNVMSKKTSNILKKGLELVINEGTGTLAKPNTVTAAGKTATAQTGKFINGKEIYSSWFCGFFPCDKPQYTVIVFCEDSSKTEKECSEIFALTADKINAIAVDK